MNHGGPRYNVLYSTRLHFGRRAERRPVEPARRCASLVTELCIRALFITSLPAACFQRAICLRQDLPTLPDEGLFQRRSTLQMYCLSPLVLTSFAGYAPYRTRFHPI